MTNHYLFKIGKIYEIEVDINYYAMKSYDKEIDCVNILFAIKGKVIILVLEKIKRSQRVAEGILLKVLLGGEILFLWFDVLSCKELNS